MRRTALLSVLAVILSVSAGAAQERPQVYDAEVGPWRLEAEDFVWWLHVTIWDDPEASGGKVVKRPGYKYMLLDDLPFPRTSKPVTIYLRVWPSMQEEQYRLTTTQDGNRQTLTDLRPEHIDKWQWLQFAPVTAEEVGDSFGVEFVHDEFGDTACDALVISTRPDLDEAALEAAPLLFTPGPLAVVGRTSSPPTLDGLGDDPCWQHTVACTGFVRIGSLYAAEADTTVKMVYDDANLYLLLACQEPILEVERQMRAKFVADITERDAEVFQDDSMFILLDPSDTGKSLYDFSVNALGTLADARCPGPDLWETRDTNWNSGAEAKGNIGDGVWTVEMAIPFADLGDTPQEGDRWQVGLGRLAKARKETTSWNPSASGFHDPIQLGTLVFSGATPGVSLTIPSSLQLGKNEMTTSLAPLAGQPSNVYVVVELTSPTSLKPRRHYGFVEVADTPGDVSQSFDVREEGELRVEYAVLDAATLKPLYLTPTLTRAVKSSVAQVKLACEGPYELYLNDELISQGAQGRSEAIAAPLQKGANVFALRLEKGTAAVAVEAPGSYFTAETWKVAAADTKDATRAALDDVSWPTAKSIRQDAQLGPVVGEPGQAVVLRRTLLWEKTRVWPTPVPAYYLARGATQHLAVIADGLPGKTLDGWTTYIATPPEFEVVGSSGFYGGSGGRPRFLCTQLGLQQVNGREMRVAKVAADEPVLSGRHFIMSLFDLFVRYREQAGEPESAEGEFIYWNEANGGNVSEPPQRFKVRLLPKLAGRQPKTLEFQLWGGWFCNLDDLAMREEILKCAQAAGFNDIVASDRWTSDHGPEYGIRETLSTNFKPGEVDLADYLKEHPDQRLITSQGQPAVRGAGHHLDLMCMTLLLGDGWPAVEAALKKRMDQVRPHTVEIDYEYGPYDGPHSCYCPRCLAAFREYAGLAPEVVLDPQIIKQQYGAQWTDFMARRVAQMFAKFKDAVHRHSPGAKFAVYSGYQTPANPEMYGINWQYIGDLQACDKAGAGYGEPEADIYRTVEALQGIPLLAGLLSVPYNTWDTTPPTPITKARVLRHLLASSGGGVLVYDRHSLDGRTWYAIAEVSRLAATYEEVFLKGKPAAMPGQDLTQAQIISADGITLVCAMNQGSKPVAYKLNLPAEAGAGMEFYSGQKVAAGQTVTCTLEPGEVAVYVLSR